MKQLFVTYTTETKKKEERQDIFKCCERKDEKINIDVNSPSLNLPENPLNNTLISSASSTTNSSIDSRKISLNIFSPDPQVSVNSCLSVNSNTNTNCSNSSISNKFLGKKYKIHFDVVKNEDNKMININNCSSNNNSNSQSIDGTILNKDLEKGESLDLSEEKNLNNINNFNLIREDNNENEKICFLNEGRWSFKEHIKFIEAIAEYGKNWKDVQKYVGSRSSAQARSHAQKFFLKLKAIKTPKSDFDFSNNNIKSLSDIIELIKRKEEYSLLGKEYIINTLINLSESISIDNYDLCKNFKKKFKNSKKNKKEKKDDEKDFEYFLLKNNHKEIKNEIFNVYNDYDIKLKESNKLNINNNENEIKEKKIIKDININFEDKNKIKEVKENDIKKIINKDTIEKSGKNRTLENNNKNNNYKNININSNKHNFKYNLEFINEPKKERYIFDDGIAYLSDDSDFFCQNNLSFKFKEYCSIKNSESPLLLFNKYFFS